MFPIQLGLLKAPKISFMANPRVLPAQIQDTWVKRPEIRFAASSSTKPLQSALKKHLNAANVAVLAFHLGVDKTTLLGSTKSEQIEALVDRMTQHGRLDELKARIQQLYPHVERLSRVDFTHAHQLEENLRIRLFQTMLGRMNETEAIRCAQLVNVPYNRLEGETRDLKLISLIQTVEKRTELPLLHAAVVSIRPDLESELGKSPDNPSFPASTSVLPPVGRQDLFIQYILMNFYEPDELHTLSFELDDSYDSLPGNGHDQKAIALVERFQKRNALNRLYAKMLKQRPDIQELGTPEAPVAVDTSAMDKQKKELLAVLSDHFSRDDLKKVCAYLSVNPEDLASNLAGGLVTRLANRRRLDELAMVMKIVRPEIVGLAMPAELDAMQERMDLGAKVKAVLMKRFSIGEIKKLAGLVNIEYDDLSGSGRDMKALALVDTARCHVKMELLITTMKALRPDVIAVLEDPQWLQTLYQPPETKPADMPGALDRKLLNGILQSRFSEEELAELAKELDIDYEDLPGSKRRKKAFEILAEFDRRQLLACLTAAIYKLRPDIQADPTSAESSPDRLVLRETILTKFSQNWQGLLNLCDELQVPLEKLLSKQEFAGQEIGPAYRAIVSYCERRKTIPSLKASLGI